MDIESLALAKGHTNEQLGRLPSNAPTKKIVFDGGIFGVGGDVLEGQVIDITIKGDIEIDEETDEIKFTQPVRVRSVGKNLFGGKNKLERQIIENVDVGVIVSSNGFDSLFLAVSPGEVYTEQNFTSQTGIPLRGNFYDINMNKVSIWPSADKTTKRMTFTIPANIHYICKGVDRKISNAMIERSNMVSSYEPYRESVIYVPEVCRSLPNGVKDEVRFVNGAWEKVQRISNNYVFVGNELVATTDDDNGTTVVYRTSPLLPSDSYSIDGVDTKVVIGGKKQVSFADRLLEINVGTYATVSSTRFIYFVFATGTRMEQANAMLTGLMLNYQLTNPIITRLPAQPPLQVFKNGTVYVEPIGDSVESTLPTVELTMPTGNYNKFSIAEHDYDGAAADWTLTDNEAKCYLLKCTNTGGDANIIAPDTPGFIYAVNNLTAKTITIKKSDGTGVAIATTRTALVIHNGIDYIKITEEV